MCSVSATLPVGRETVSQSVLTGSLWNVCPSSLTSVPECEVPLSAITTHDSSVSRPLHLQLLVLTLLPFHSQRLPLNDNVTSQLNTIYLTLSIMEKWSCASNPRLKKKFWNNNNKLVRLIAVTVCGPANVNKTKDTTRPQGWRWPIIENGSLTILDVRS